MLERCSSPPRAPRRAYRRALVCALGAFNVLSVARADDLTIRHEAPACLLAEAFPRLTAETDPPGQAIKMRVAFRPEAATVWHGVAAEAADDRFIALLPRPRLSARTIHYRFEATRPNASVVTSAEFTATVVADATTCPGTVAETVPSATVLVDVPPGAPMVPPVPAGFDPVGAVSSAPHKGSSKKKLGVLTGVVVGGAAVAGGVLAAGSEPPPTTQLLAPRFMVQSITPPPFGQVSISAPNFSAEVIVVTPRSLAAGEAWVAFYGAGNPPERPCAVVAGNHPPMEPGHEARFTIRSPFIHIIPCGTTNSARIYFRSPSGQTLYQSGLSGEVGSAGLLDASVAYTFVP